MLDYQVVVGASDDFFVKNVASKELFSKLLQRAGRVPKNLPRSRRKPDPVVDTTCLMAKGREYHRITYDLDTRINIVRYVEKSSCGTSSGTIEYPYHYLLWSEGEKEFRPKHVSFEHAQERVNWNTLDNMLAIEDYKSEMEALPWRRVNLSIIPRERPNRRILDALDDKRLFSSSADSIAMVSQFTEAVLKSYPGNENSGLFHMNYVSDPIIWANFHQITRSQSGFAQDQRSKKILKFTLSSQDQGWLVIEHDTHYHPFTCLQFSVLWFVARGASIGELIQTMQRKAKNLGLTIVTIPYHFIGGREGHLQPRCRVLLTSLQALLLKDFLLSEWNFVLDSTTSSTVTFLHSTGLALVRICMLPSQPGQANLSFEALWLNSNLPEIDAEEQLKLTTSFHQFIRNTSSESRAIHVFVERLCDVAVLHLGLAA